jgi:ABC-2 type transport system ATP-binding protein
MWRGGTGTYGTAVDASPALEARALAKRYSRRRSPALSGLDLTLDGAGLTALVGPNGAGKSTLIKAWVGLERPSAGHVFVRGIDLWRDRPGALRQLGYVPQQPALYRALTIAEHLELAASLRPGFDRPYAERRLEELGLPLDVRCGELSGGQGAQVGLALALGTRAPVLLLDEPLASLDPLARREFLHVLTEAARADGTTVLLSSHIVTDVEQACERIIVLGVGRVVLQSTIADALATHAVRDGLIGLPVAAPADAAGTSFASFAGPGGDVVSLVRHPRETRPSGSRPATLEEVVLGHLAAARLPRAGAAA